MSNIKNARFCFNNWVESGSLTASSAQSSYPAANITSGIRSKVWKANGLFEISTANNNVYINETTFTLTVGSYTAATLITHFNSVTSETLSRNSNGRFVITLGSSGTLNLSSTTNAIWSTLGFLTSSNLTGTVFTADERRYNTSEWLLVDLLQPQTADFAAVIPPANTIFSAPTASIYLQGNNTNVWTAPQVDEQMIVSSEGAFYASSEALEPCRYWRIKFVDVKNNDISASVVYIGDSTINTNTNLAVGFTRARVDQSVRLSSEAGQLYVERKPRLVTLSSMSVQYLKGQELTDMEQLVYDLGTGRPFFICIDPSLSVSTSLPQMTHYVEVDSEPTFSHVLNSYYNLSFSLREVL
jgi:hypothetical protein